MQKTLEPECCLHSLCTVNGGFKISRIKSRALGANREIPGVLWGFALRKFFGGKRGEMLAARLGLEPRQAESESAVLPLHHRAVKDVRDSTDHRVSGRRRWSRRWDSNPQPPVYKTGALPLSYAGEKRRPRYVRVIGKQPEIWWLPGDSNPEPID